MRDSAADATLIGTGAIVLWGSLAWLTTLAGAVPPLALVGMTFGIAFLLWLLRVAIAAAQGVNILGPLLSRPGTLVLPTAGLFFYHVFYFGAFARAPAAEASLIAYLWPLLIVFFSGFLPGNRFQPRAVLGAALGFAAVAIMIENRSGLTFSASYAWGYGLAFGCALIWSSYSALSRLVPDVSSDAIGPACMVTAVLGMLGHAIFESPLGPIPLIPVALLGAGPVGLAFFAWDYGVKRGDLKVLGVLSYASPLLSISILTLAGTVRFTPILFGAAALIALGAVLAGRRSSP
ncbi:MAG TPA: EamA family transporter [Dongiaceae bacterium]|jgi:drug/metabolite transporter (DMT)-like permease|nr:EamA family transporter [Dongiaceae bacterium]